MDIAYVNKLDDTYYVVTTCGQEYSFHPRSAQNGDNPLLIRRHQDWMLWVADPTSGPCPAYIALENDGDGAKGASLVFYA